MSKNRDVFVIVGTVFAVVFGIPVLDRLADFANSAINKKINGWQLSMELDQREAQVAAEVISPSPSITNVVGFEIPSEGDDYDYE